MNTGTTIGELAKELRLNPKTIRYYEELGLLPEPRRSPSGYRLYSEAEIERLRLILRAKLLGLSLVEIKELVDYAIDGRCGSLENRLLALVEVKLGEIDRRIADLTTMRAELGRYKADLALRLETGKSRSKAVPSACRCLESSQPKSLIKT
jgi:DNA-binding transcriptional MerR regulator